MGVTLNQPQGENGALKTQGPLLVAFPCGWSVLQFARIDAPTRMMARSTSA